MKKLLAMIAALGLLCSLAACNNDPAPAATDTPDPAPTEEQGIAGTYHFEYVDKYGDTTRFSIRLRADETFTIMTSLGSLGDNLCSGTNWTDNGDGTFTTGATDNVLELDFIAADGTITWTILDDDGTVTPVGYVEPTEFEEKPVEDDNSGVSSGIYTYKENNGFMDIEWVMLLRADGIYELTENNRDTYVGPYTIEGTQVICGAMTDVKPQLFDWCNPEGFTITTGATTFVPEFDGRTLEGEEPATAIPQGYIVATGCYVYEENNGFMDITWEMLLLADGTYALTENSRDTYVGPYTIEGTQVICGAMTDVKPQLFDWCNLEGFTITTGATTFVPEFEGRTLEGEEPAAPVPQGTLSKAPVVYTLDENNGFMDISWELELREDGSYALTEVGRDTYVGESYTQDGDTIVCGPMLNAPLLFTWANPEGFTVTVDGSTFAPVE